MNLLTKNDFETLVLMLNGSIEDKELALSNIKNLNLSPIYTIIFLKELCYDNRKKFYDKFNEEINNVNGFKYLSLDTIEYIFFRKQDKLKKIIETYYNEKDIIDCFNFVYRHKKNIKIKLDTI
jgi:hypothetical protein